MIMYMCHSLINLNVAYTSAQPFDLDFVQERHFQNEDVQFADVSRALYRSGCGRYTAHVHWVGDMRVGLKITLLL